MDAELLFVADGDAGRGKPLSERCLAGELVRLRRGVYVADDAWSRLPAWERDRLRILAAVESAVGTRILVQEAAAVMWGIPVVGALP